MVYKGGINSSKEKNLNAVKSMFKPFNLFDIISEL